MNEQHLKIFVDSATHYFKHLSNEPAAVQVPYLIDHDESLVYDCLLYTSVRRGPDGRRSGRAPRAAAGLP